MAYLYGTFSEDGANVIVEALYEPPQQGSAEGFELEDDPREEQASAAQVPMPASLGSTYLLFATGSDSGGLARVPPRGLDLLPPAPRRGLLDDRQGSKPSKVLFSTHILQH